MYVVCTPYTVARYERTSVLVTDWGHAERRLVRVVRVARLCEVRREAEDGVRQVDFLTHYLLPASPFRLAPDGLMTSRRDRRELSLASPLAFSGLCAVWW
jgi:hypothetical protein